MQELEQPREIMRMIFVIAAVIMSSHGCFGQDLVLFNPDVLGALQNENIKLLLGGDTNAIAPIEISLELESGRYIGATIVYPKSVSFIAIKKSLNSLYKQFEYRDFKDNKTMDLWRHEPKRFAIQLSEDKEGVRVIYLVFQPISKAMKNIMDAMKSLRDAEKKRKR